MLLKTGNIIWPNKKKTCGCGQMLLCMNTWDHWNKKLQTGSSPASLEIWSVALWPHRPFSRPCITAFYFCLLLECIFVVCGWNSWVDHVLDLGLVSQDQSSIEVFKVWTLKTSLVPSNWHQLSSSYCSLSGCFFLSSLTPLSLSPPSVHLDAHVLVP